MKLLHLVHTPRHSGAEVLVRDLCLEHLRGGVECAIAAFAPSTPEFEAEIGQMRAAGISTFIPRRRLSGFGRVAGFANAIRQFRPDAVFGHATLPSIYGRAAMLMSASRARFVSVLHSATDDYADPKLRLGERLLGRRNDCIISVSQSAADRFAGHLRRHAPVEIVLNGVNLQRFRTAFERRDQIRASLGLHSSQKLVLQIGRISPVKQQLTTLDALGPLLEQRSELVLWFAGIVEDVAYHDEFLARIASSPDPDRVRFLGPRNDIADLLCAADVYVMPSKSEAHSIAFLEAMASGVAIVGSNIESFAFAAGSPGVQFIEPANAVGFCAAVEAFLTGERYARELVNSFSLNATASAYERIARGVPAGG